MNNRRETYGKYVYRRRRAGKEQIFARVGYTDRNGQMKYVCRRANSEEHAERLAQKLIERLRTRPPLPFTDEELTELFFAVQYREIDFRDFRRKIIDFCAGKNIS